jgi:hypothetical protein
MSAQVPDRIFHWTTSACHAFVVLHMAIWSLSSVSSRSIYMDRACGDTRVNSRTKHSPNTANG